MDKKIGFIGAGNMGGALIVAAANSIGSDQVLIADHMREKAELLATQVGCETAENNDEIVRRCELVVLAVKPNVMRDVVRAISPAVSEKIHAGEKLILVTIAAGVTIDTIKQCLTVEVPVIRIMPNTPVAVGQGMILLTGGEEVTEEMYSTFKTCLAKAGDFEWLDESAIDITSSISGCTPAYAYMFIDALAVGAVQVGVPRPQALRLAAKTVLGSAAMVLQSGLHPDELKDNVCSPGGSTIVGVTALEENRFRYAVEQAIIQSTEKNCALGK